MTYPDDPSYCTQKRDAKQPLIPTDLGKTAFADQPAFAVGMMRLGVHDDVLGREVRVVFGAVDLFHDGCEGGHAGRQTGLELPTVMHGGRRGRPLEGRRATRAYRHRGGRRHGGRGPFVVHGFGRAHQEVGGSHCHRRHGLKASSVLRH